MAITTVIHKARVSHNKLVMADLDKYCKDLLHFEGKDVDVNIRFPRKHRSNQANRYYWGVVIKILSEETGYNENEMHDALRLLFLRDTDVKIPTLRSTALLSTVEFEEYLSKVRTWASQELSCYVPTPNEIDY